MVFFHHVDYICTGDGKILIEIGMEVLFTVVKQETGKHAPFKALQVTLPGRKPFRRQRLAQEQHQMKRKRSPPPQIYNKKPQFHHAAAKPHGAELERPSIKDEVASALKESLPTLGLGFPSQPAAPRPVLQPHLGFSAAQDGFGMGFSIAPPTSSFTWECRRFPKFDATWHF